MIRESFNLPSFHALMDAMKWKSRKSINDGKGYQSWWQSAVFEGAGKDGNEMLRESINNPINSVSFVTTRCLREEFDRIHSHEHDAAGEAFEASYSISARHLKPPLLSIGAAR